jgi:YidC/Oxa1 family membrane protein insertase
MDTRRLILVMIFAFSSFMLWENWQQYKHPKPVAELAATAAKTGADGAVPTPSVSLQAGGTPVAGEPAAPVSTAETFSIDTDLMKVTISTLGGDLVGLELFNYKENDAKDKNFVLFDSKHQYYAQSGLIGEGLPSHRSVFRRVDGPMQLASGSDELKVRLEANGPEGVQIAKILTFKRNSYVIDIAWEISNGSGKVLTPHAYYQIQRDDAAPAGDMAMMYTFTGPAVYTDAEKYQKLSFSDIADKSAKFAKTADNGWMAMVQHYFVSAFVPQAGVQREFYMRKLDNSNLYQAGVIVPVGEIAPGNSSMTNVTLFAGPQEQAALKEISPGLDLVVDYGFLTVIAAPIFWALQFIHGIVGNWGWAIVVLTI